MSGKVDCPSLAPCIILKHLSIGGAQSHLSDHCFDLKYLVKDLMKALVQGFVSIEKIKVKRGVKKKQGSRLQRHEVSVY